MSRLIYKVELYKKDADNVYSGTADLTITDAVNLDADASIETGADSFMVRIKNVKVGTTYPYRDQFEIDARVMIWCKEDDSSGTWTAATDLLFDGLVMETKYEMNSNGNFLTIQGLNRLEKLLAASKPANYNYKTASFIINNLISSVNNDQAYASGGSQVNQITWDSGNAATTTEINYSKTYRSVFEMVEELSQIQTNKEGNFIYYLDESNNFIWIAKSFTSQATLTEGTDFHSMKVTNKIWEVINAMILDCGKDAYGKTVITLYYDETSAAKYGLKWATGKETETEIAERIQNEEEAQNSASFDDDSKPFPTAAALAAGYVFYRNERDSSGTVLATNKTVTTKAGYNAEIRTQAKWEGIAYAKSVINLVGTVRPKVTLSVRGAHWYNSSGLNQPRQGELITLNTSSMPLSESSFSKNLRITGLNHVLDKNGWIVELTLDEDIEGGGS